MSENLQSRWYFGGLAGSAACCFTHPLDLMKVHLQTQKTKVSMPVLAANIAKTDGLAGFYAGLTASIMRQMTYTFMRFGAYEGLKTQVKGDSFMHKVALAGTAGALGGLVGSPADLVNVRMQNDVKLPYAQRRNYKNAVDGVYQIIKNEGAGTLFNGGSMAVARAILMTIGQLAFYDQVKATLLKNQLMDDCISTHLFSSFVAASSATILTQPVDVLKTRMMNAKNGQYKGVVDCFLQTARGGPTAFYSGLVPSFVRMAPHTILLFVFVEQLRMNFGYLRPQKLGQ